MCLKPLEWIVGVIACSHSFLIGTVLAQISDSLIQTLGHWELSAVLDYLRMDVETLVGTASKLSL